MTPNAKTTRRADQSIECTYSVDDNGKWQGECIGYHDCGRISHHAHYKDDKLHGEYMTFSVGGLIIHHSLYENGRLIADAMAFGKSSTHTQTELLKMANECKLPILRQIIQ